MRRILAIIICGLICLTGFVVGCSNTKDKGKEGIEKVDKVSENVSSNNENTQNDSLGKTPPGTFPLVEKKITLTFFAPQHPLVVDLATNEMTMYMEELTNVHIEWKTAPQAAIEEKRKLVLASADYPDVFFNAGITKEEEMQYGSEGVFIPLNDLIDEYGVYIKKMFDEVDYFPEALTTPDGNIYGLPQYNECYQCSFSQKMWIHKPWLDKLGLKMPTTTEEFYNVLKAFKDQDPNENGKADEIPLSGCINGWRSNPADFLMCAFIYNDGADRIILNNGKVDFAPNKPEWREGLKYVHSLYKEGLLDPAAFTQDADQLKQLGENPDIVILGAAANGTVSNFTNYGPGSGRIATYEAVPPLKGPNGVQTTGYYPFSFTSAVYVITKECEHPDIALRWADWLYSEEGTMRSVYGVPGRDWREASEGEIGVNGKPAKWVVVNDVETSSEPNNVAWRQMGPSHRPRDLRDSKARVVPESFGDFNFFLPGVLSDETENKYDGYQPDEVYPPVYMTTEQIEEIAQIKTEINQYVTESMARFITGDLDIDNDWEDYLKGLENAGLDQYLEILQSAYDVQYGK